MRTLVWHVTLAVGVALVLVAGCRSLRPPPGPAVEAITPAHRALAARVEAAMKLAADTPGREFANRLRSEQRPDWLAQLRGEAPAPVGSLARAVRDLEGCCRLAEAGPGWPRPPLARVPRATGPLTIDGKLDDAEWGKALTYTGLYAFNEQGRREDPKTTWKLLWDDQCLYFAYDCADPDLIAAQRARDGDVYFDDCVEVFLLPEPRFRVYWEIDITPAGCVYDSIQTKHPDLWDADKAPSVDLNGLRFAVTVRGTLNQSDDVDQGYTVEVAVPFAELPEYSRVKPQPGQRLHFMLTRLDVQGKQFTAYAYQPLLGWGHNLWNHAELELLP